MKKVMIIVCLFLGIAAIQAQNLLSNGSFENGTFVANDSHQQTNNVDNSGNSDITSWDRDGGVWWIHDPTRATEGNRFMYAKGLGVCNGQTFIYPNGVITGCKTYQVELDIAGYDDTNPGGGVGLSTFSCEIKYHSGSTEQVNSRKGWIDISNNSLLINPMVPSAWNSIQWKRVRGIITVPNPTAAGTFDLQFQFSSSSSLSGATAGILVDNIVITEVPIPTPPSGGTCIGDKFCDKVYNNPLGAGAGFNNWTGNWTEENGDASATTGNIIVKYGALQFNNSSSPTTPKIYRNLNLTNATAATLSFFCNTTMNLEPADVCVLEISTNGGASYTTLETFTGDVAGFKTYNILPYASANTRIRFAINSSSAYTSSSEAFFITNLEVCASAAASCSLTATATKANDLTCATPTALLTANSTPHQA